MMNGDLNIEQMFAFIVRDPADGTEGVIGTMTPTGLMPLVGADPERASSLIPIAQETANLMGVTVTLALFSKRENVDSFEPNKTIPKPKGVDLGNGIIGVVSDN